MKGTLAVIVVALCAVMVFGACSDDGDDTSGTPTGAVALLGFGEACTDNAQCESDICHQFGQGPQLCSIACTTDAECPAGSQGQKCNDKGVWKP